MASLPGDELQKIQIYPENPLLKIILSDPFMHFLVFGLLALLICRGFNRKSGRSIPLAIVAVLAIGFGFLIEVYQGILPWRSFGLDDFFWNTVGVLFFLALVGMFRGVGHGGIDKSFYPEGSGYRAGGVNGRKGVKYDSYKLCQLMRSNY